MPNRRPCACDKCGRKFDLVHHLPRHAVLLHGLGYRVDPETDCVQAYRPSDLAELQERLRGWQGRPNERDSRSRSPRQSASEALGRRSRVSSRGRAARGRRPRSRSPRFVEVDQPSGPSPRRRSTPAERNLSPGDSRIVDASRDCREPVSRQERLEGRRGASAALGAPATEQGTETLDTRIERLLQSPAAPESPSQLADISFGSAGADPFDNCVVSAPPALPPRSTTTVPAFAAALSLSTSMTSGSAEQGVLRAGDISVLFEMWPAGVEEAWRLLCPGRPLPVEGSPELVRFHQDLRVARSAARTMAGLLLSLPGFEDSSDRLPACVIDWLCR